VNPLDILYVAGGAWLAAAVAGLLAGSWRLGLRACCILSGLGGAAAAAGGGWSLVHGDTPVVTPGGASATIVGGPLQLQATSLAGVFVALLGIVAVAIAWYVPRYHEPSRGTGVYLAAYNLALLACLGVLAAGGMVTFLVAWESMSLACYLVILRRPRSDESARGAFWFLALSEIGFLLIVAAFVILSAKTHATQLDVMAARGHLVPGGWRAAAYLLALAGFGCKAGLVPLHVWLPEAHPVAPADGSAFLSGVVVNLGAYGIALFAFQLDPVSGAWPGRPGHHGRRGGHRRYRHPVRPAGTGHQAVPGLLDDRELRDYRDRVRRGHGLPRLPAAGTMGVPADRRALPRR